jgi:hypothetical protein
MMAWRTQRCGIIWLLWVLLRSSHTTLAPWGLLSNFKHIQQVDDTNQPRNLGL